MVADVQHKKDGHLEIFLHRVANETVAEAAEYDCSDTVFEDLIEIRANVPEVSWHHL